MQSKDIMLKLYFIKLLMINVIIIDEESLPSLISIIG